MNRDICLTDVCIVPDFYFSTTDYSFTAFLLRILLAFATLVVACYINPITGDMRTEILLKKQVITPEFAVLDESNS